MAGSEARSSGRALAVLAIVAAPVAAYFAVKVTLAGAAPAAAVTAAALPPSDPIPVLRGLTRASQNPKFRIPANFVDAAHAGLADAPLAFEPFFIVARAEEQAGRQANATALMEEALRRRPTYSPTRLQLILYYMQAQRYPEAFKEMDVLLRRNSDVQRALLPELAKLISVPAGREALADLLAAEPEWREAFVAAADKQKVHPADARALFELVRARKPRGGVELERQLMLQAQVSSGQYGAARETALAALPTGERAVHARLFDGQFRGVRVPKPFGWTFTDSDVGRAEPATEGAQHYLDVSYFGARDIVLAEQLLALSPGRYTLRTSARRDGTQNGGRLAWQILCRPSNASAGALDLGRAGGSFTPLSATVDIPASGCSGQVLRLIAEAGEISSTVNLQIAGLELTR